MAEEEIIDFLGTKLKIQTFQPDTLFQQMLEAKDGTIFMLDNETFAVITKSKGWKKIWERNLRGRRWSAQVATGQAG